MTTVYVPAFSVLSSKPLLSTSLILYASFLPTVPNSFGWPAAPAVAVTARTAAAIAAAKIERRIIVLLPGGGVSREYAAAASVGLREVTLEEVDRQLPRAKLVRG